MRTLGHIIYGLLWLVDGFHDMRRTTHPIRDIRTYLESRKAA